MANIKNISSSLNFYGTVWELPQVKDPQPAWELTPGKIFPVGSPVRSWTYAYFFKNPYQQGVDQVAFWRGRIHNGDAVDVLPDASEVRIRHNSITVDNLNNFKKLYEAEHAVQQVTLEQLIQNATALYADGSTAVPSDEPPTNPPRGIVTPCNYAKAIIAIDCVFLLTGMIGLRSKISKPWIDVVAEALEPQMAEIDKIIMRLANAQTATDKAWQIFALGKLIYTGGMFEAIYKAIVGSLTWWDMIFYGVLGLAEIVGAFVTDGADLLPVIVADLALAGFLVSDIEKAKEECGWGS